MLKRVGLIALGALLAVAAMEFYSTMASAYDPYVLDNLKRSRDALLDQRAELRRAYDETSRQMDALQQKLGRIDQYLRQLDQSIRDVNRAIDQASN